MHPIFQTDEILRLIVSHVAYPTRYSPSWSYTYSSSAANNMQNVNHGTNLSNNVSTRSNGGHVNWTTGQFVPCLGANERKALAKMAFVCRTWEGVALDALWREIPTVEPLFALFPPSCISGATRHESLQFTRPLVPSDWTRFAYYAHRVHRIALPDSRWPRFTVDIKTFLSLSHFHPYSPILPNLQHWSWDTHRGSGDIVGGMCFLSSSVTSISVTLGHATSHDTLFGFLYNLPMRCPHLEQLELCYNDREWPDWGLEATMTTLQRVFEELTELKRLCLPFFMDTPVFVRKVGSIPGLKELVVGCPDKLVGAFVDDDSDEGTIGIGPSQPGMKSESEELFPDLETVTLQSTMSSCFRFLRRFSSRNIQRMYLTVLHLRSASQLEECVQLIANSSPHLKVFHLQYTPAQHDVSFDTSYFRLDTLKTCGELEEVSIAHPRVAPWTDDDVLEAIRCWPRLKALRLNPRPSRAVVESRLTLKTLWNLVHWCRNLEVIRFYVDTTTIPNLSQLAALEPSSGEFTLRDSLCSLGLPGLGSLGVAGIKGSSVLSLIDFGISQRTEASTQELATFIATLCPVAQVQSSEMWKEVGVILKVNQATREEDRRRIETLRSEVERLSRLLAAGGQI